MTDHETSAPHPAGLDLVTGAFGNVGTAIADRLLASGRRVRTLTSHPRQHSDIDVMSYEFDDPEALAARFDGVETFYNTFWMRTGDDDGHYGLAVDRCKKLITAAETGGVGRIVHISVAHPSADSPYPYFRGKAAVEQRLVDSSVPATAVRPSLIFGGDDVMFHNLAWMLRRLPVFAVAGDGRYRVRPVHVDDIARICTDAGARPADAGPGFEVIDAVGPDRPTYTELVAALRDAVGSRTRIVKAPLPLVLGGAKVLGVALRDKLLTRDEMVSTMEGLADTDGPATGEISLLEWLQVAGPTLGTKPKNERASRS